MARSILSIAISIQSNVSLKSSEEEDFFEDDFLVVDFLEELLDLEEDDELLEPPDLVTTFTVSACTVTFSPLL